MGGISASSYLDDVELVPLGSTSNELPQLSPLPIALGHSAAALDYSSKSVHKLWHLRLNLCLL